MNLEQTKDAIVANLRGYLDNYEWRAEKVGEAQKCTIASAYLHTVEWLWEQYETWDNGGGDGSLFEAQLIAIAKELGVSDDS